MYVASFGPNGAPPVLLLLGGGVAGWMWDSLRRRLEGDHRVVVPDLPGHGRSADEPYMSHSETVDALARLITTPVTVVGFSLGAQLAIELASRHPQLVNQAVIVSAQAKAMPLTGLTLSALGLSAPLARRRWFAQLQARELFIPPDLLEDYISASTGITKATLLAAVADHMRFELPAAWSAFRGRVLVMAGREERRLMRESAAAIHAAQPGSEATIVDGCGHGIPLQKPDWFDDRLTEWIAQV